MDYEEKYYFMHNENIVEVVVNMLKDNFDLSVFKKYHNGVSIYGLTINQVEQLFKDIGLYHIISFMDYQTDYDYFENPVDNLDCVEVTFKSVLFDLND